MQGRGGGYARFGAMIATSMLAMFALMYLNTYAPAHVRFSETRLFMTFIMGAGMAVVMLSFMLAMYPDRRVNLAIYAASLLVFALSLWLVRSQATVGDRAYMKAMIPHHSIAILTSERARIGDARVRELADGIIRAQRREIKEMDWLIDDIEKNGPARTPAEAAARPVPDFKGETEAEKHGRAPQ
ncbi:MAG: DUF305 domain-containing protein [Pseudomonadota bacterium]|nr:DUF305 domain-containing protein [Pseudomonadota bacterium]